MGFKAEGSVPALEWDFRPYVDASGVSPEPSGTAMFAFQQNYTNATMAAKRQAKSRAALIDETNKKTGDELREDLRKWAECSFEDAVQESAQLLDKVLTSEYATELVERIAELVHNLTDGCPNKDQIMALPGRVRSQFLGWFVGEVSNPEV
jgi:K+-transporting ATPase c subunit